MNCSLERKPMSEKYNDDIIERLFALKNYMLSESKIADILNSEFGGRYTKDSVGGFYRRNKELIKQEADDEVIEEGARLSKQLQRYQDRNRIERKSWRNIARYENFFEDYCNELIKTIKTLNFNYEIKKHSINPNHKGIIHLTDLHFNELVSLPSNKYDFEIASKRLKKLAIKAAQYFKLWNITDIGIFCTGDFINSDRRIDEMLNMATTRAQSVFVAIKILEQFIHELSQDFNIVFSGVSGNESRIQQDLGFSDLAASDNYDFTIYNILKYLFADKPIKFEFGNSNEIVCEFNGQNILLLHGYNFSRNNIPERQISEVIAKYNDKGIVVNFVIFGHFHSSIISERYARGGSLVGANSYSTYLLDYSSSASQNIHIVSKTGEIDSIKIDLQDVNNYEGYEIKKEKELYLIRDSIQERPNIIKF